MRYFSMLRKKARTCAAASGTFSAPSMISCSVAEAPMAVSQKSKHNLC